MPGDSIAGANGLASTRLAFRNIERSESVQGSRFDIQRGLDLNDYRQLS